MTQLRLLACGSRNHRDFELIRSSLLLILHDYPVYERQPLLIEGGQVSRDWNTRERFGADYLAKRAWTEIGREMALDLDLIEEPADWTGPCDPAFCRRNHRKASRAPGGGDYCPAAGFRRNARMLNEHKPTRGIAFPQGRSNGTWDMIERMQDAGIPVDVIEPGAVQAPQLRLIGGGRA